MPKYVLPDLPYDYAALEPHISADILKLHHGKHHAAYVAGANKVLEQLEEARAANNFGAIAGLQRALAFNVSGHVLHSIFWNNMMPKGGGEPTGELGDLIKRDFGTFAAFKAHMNNVAMTTMGSGWAALCWEPVAQRLVVQQIHDHQTDTTTGGAPLMVIDAWEHAFYLQYKNDKASFFEAIWSCWNWNDVSARLKAARAIDAQLPKAIG